MILFAHLKPPLYHDTTSYVRGGVLQQMRTGYSESGIVTAAVPLLSKEVLSTRPDVAGCQGRQVTVEAGRPQTHP